MSILIVFWWLGIIILSVCEIAIILKAIKERFQFLASIKLPNIRQLSNHFLITLIGILIAIPLYLPSLQQTIRKYDDLDTIFIEVGGMIGTIIALIFSLSIISVQRAVETFTPYVSRLYREDPKTHLVFLILVVLCILSFVFSIDGILFGISRPKLLPIQIIIVAITYDLSRLHYRRISQLMDTTEAINMLVIEMRSHINNLQKGVAKKAKEIWSHSIDAENKKNLSVERIETLIYRNNPRHEELLHIGIGELSEIANRSISNGQYYISVKAISSLRDIAIYYLDQRKKNISLFPEPSMPLSGVIISDADKILDQIYEYLSDINRKAVESKAQLISIEIVEALERIGEHLLTLGPQTYEIAWKPIAYLGVCVAKAQESQLFDVSLRASRALLRFGLAVPKGILDINVYVPLFQRWQNVVQFLLLSRNTTVADLVLKDMMALVHHIQNVKPTLFELHFSFILSELYKLLPLCIANERQFESPFAPYAMTNNHSLGYIIEDASTLITPSQNEWINPYSDFIELNKELSGHFRSIAEHLDIGSSNLVWEISQTIKHISNVFLNLLETPATNNNSYIDDLINQIAWYLSFFWAAFKKSPKVDQHFVWEACKQTAWIGLVFYEKGFVEVAKDSISAISSIATSFHEKGGQKNYYPVADLLIFIWNIRLLAEAKNDSSFIKYIDDQILKLDVLNGEGNEYISQAFEERKFRLRRELTEVNHSPFMDNPSDLLRRLLNTKYQSMLHKLIRDLYG